MMNRYRTAGLPFLPPTNALPPLWDALHCPRARIPRASLRRPRVFENDFEERVGIPFGRPVSPGNRTRRGPSVGRHGLAEAISARLANRPTAGRAAAPSCLGPSRMARPERPLAFGPVGPAGPRGSTARAASRRAGACATAPPLACRHCSEFGSLTPRASVAFGLPASAVQHTMYVGEGRCHPPERDACCGRHC